MKSHLVLMRTILQELGDGCCTSTTLDWKTIERRVEHEGLEFLTITLPSFAKDFLKCLDQGYVDSTHFLSFKKRACLPAFLQGFTSLVFDSQSGLLLHTPEISAIHSVLQICNLFSKVELPCSDAREHAAFRQYVETDKEIQETFASIDPILMDEFKEVSFSLWREIFIEMDESIYNGDIVPKHGPGATADGIRGNAKFRQQQWTQRLEELFPHGEFVFPNWRYFDADRVELLEPENELPVRVISVPKTQKTPRIIAIEPACMQYVQQGLLERLVMSIERHDSLSVLIGFDDQVPNQELARIGSQDGSLATLDLSEASDRVSWPLVQALVDRHPLFKEALDCTRSRRADVPGHGVIPLFKYASMGSALCFPVEAMVFLTIVIMGIRRERGYHISPRALSREMRGKVRVYGDDIIVPVEYVRSVVSLLEAFGLKVNSNKSFWTGKFRESCGKEFYDGRDVSIVKVRRPSPTQRKHASEIHSLVSLRNQLYKAGLWSSCKYLDNTIERLIPFPVVLESSQAIGRHSFLGYETQSECKYLQRPLVRAAVLTSIIPKSNLSDDAALLKFFLKRGSLPLSNNHLLRAGRPESVNIKIRRVSPY